MELRIPSGYKRSQNRHIGMQGIVGTLDATVIEYTYGNDNNVTYSYRTQFLPEFLAA